MTVARAQSADAEALFNDGNRLMNEHKIAEACDAFEASNRIEMRAGTLIRLGECREENHQLASAWSAYKDALTRVKDPKKRTIATAKIAQLEPRLSELTIAIPDANRVAGLELTRNGQPLDPGLWNRAVPVNGGAYTIVARAPGYRDWQTTTKVPDESGKIVVDIPKLESAASPTPTVVGAPRPPAATGATAPAEGDVATSTWTGRRKLALSSAGLTVASGIGGVVFGVLAKSKQQDAEKLCTPNVPCVDGARAQALLGTAHDRALDANIAFAIAGAAAIAAGVLWFTGAPERGVAVVPSAHAATLVLGGSF